MSMVSIFVSALIGYIFGCIQTAYIVGRLVKKIDIRQYGSNNAGASNVTTVLGWKYGIITAILDIGKAAAAVIAVNYLFPGEVSLEVIAGAFAVIGHIFPFVLKFKGGKGAASLIGMFIVLNIKIAIILALLIVVITLIVDYIAIGSIAMFTAVPIATLFSGFPIEATLVCVVLTLICYYKHYINIIRIIRGEETGLRKVINKKQNKHRINM